MCTCRRAQRVVRQRRRLHNLWERKHQGDFGGRGPVATRSVALGRPWLVRLGGYSSSNSGSRRKQTEEPSTPKPIITAAPTLTVELGSRNHPDAVLPFSTPSHPHISPSLSCFALLPAAGPPALTGAAHLGRLCEHNRPSRPFPTRISPLEHLRGRANRYVASYRHPRLGLSPSLKVIAS